MTKAEVNFNYFQNLIEYPDPLSIVFRLECFQLSYGAFTIQDELHTVQFKIIYTVKIPNQLKILLPPLLPPLLILSLQAWRTEKISQVLVESRSDTLESQATERGGIMGRLDGIIELPMAFHENCVGPIVQKIASATIGARSNNAAILYFGYTSTRTPRTGKEADTSWRPVAKPPVNAGGSDPTGV
uniref:Uncharacterized protein n=1 Tax=Rhizophagus irregularis (strain DAOM 181602 / DAOM 197198 / MUCL 43194) TaxID=747089 RepID=U9UKW3_RHIID